MNKVSQFFNWLAHMIRRFASWWWSVFRKQSIIVKFIFASVSLCVICFLCGLPSVILSPSRTPTSLIESDPISESNQVAVSPTDTPVLTNTPIPKPTNTPIPTATPNPTRFQTGQKIYLVPSMKNIEDGRAVYKLSDALFFSSVSSCDDLRGREPIKTWIYHNQPGKISDVIVCEDTTYYLVKVEDAGSIYEAWEDWLSEDQLSGEPISPFGLPFYTALASDYEDAKRTAPYLPVELVYYEGQEAKTTFNDQPVRLTLNSINDREDRLFSTAFTLFNDGTEKIEFNTIEFFQAKSNHRVRGMKTTGILSQEIPADVSVESGQNIEFEIVWKAIRKSDEIIYIAINTGPIPELVNWTNPPVFIYENSIFFRVYLSESEE